MLRALEMAGFKSFADHTRFDFPPGITVVVGPNGSGKSNIVDAIKWVLGEQSVKSLRGKEMVDVIFNGSGSRPPLHSAESTLVLDNAQRLLAIDSPEVRVTRRVYRSGEGEYLINGQACRLRDIRELFAGTGIATEAYSVIEQGKVDVLLQSSPRDRRVIFEEAAGISRFKAKKVEAGRRLDRVEQNLLRLSDIVQEVESRLRSVRLQAGKARRYRELADRLQELRTQLAIADWQTFTAQIDAQETEIADWRNQVADRHARAELLEARVLELEIEIGEAERNAHASEIRTAQHRERIAAQEAFVEQERARRTEIEQEIERQRGRLAVSRQDSGDLANRRAEAEQALARAEAECSARQREVEEGEARLREAAERLREVRSRETARRSEHLENLRASAALESQASALESRRTAAEMQAKQAGARAEDLAQLVTAAERQQAQLREQKGVSEAELGEREASFAQLAASLEARRAELHVAEQEAVQLRQRLSAASSRASVLEELEKRREGLGAGVKEVMRRSAEEASPLADAIAGLVADLVRVQVEHARLVELALGDRAQYLVLRDQTVLHDLLRREPLAVSGRVGFISLDGPTAECAGRAELSGQPGVIKRMAELVETLPDHRLLAERLLGTTWLVADLAAAIRLAPSAPGLRFVTLSGEMIEAEGLLSVGPPHAGGGLISRRSELQVLAEQIADLGVRVEAQEAVVAQLREQIAADQTGVEQAADAVKQAAAAAQVAELQLEAAGARACELAEQQHVAAQDAERAQRDGATCECELRECRNGLEQVRSRLAALEHQLAADIAAADALEQVRRDAQAETTTGRVALARAELGREELRARLKQLELDQQQRAEAVAEGWRQVEDLAGRVRQRDRQILAAEGELAQLFLRKEAFHRETIEWVAQRDLLRNQRQEAADQVRSVHQQARKLEESAHARELAVGELRLQRSTLVERLQEDYELNLAELAAGHTPVVFEDRAAVEEEVADLRRKITNLGGVNADALGELDELESRFEHLSTQHADLTAAKQALEQIIARINADSRKLFAATLETVKGHFEELFRKLFGGGSADIVLDEGVDILDSGIEIVARPPGKEPRNISLLSGGEKTLTCVALLLAIFRSRPSPFCVLDEVDAALDEANIERFVGVLQDFLAWTQFIVVTHSKKTMTCAHTLYGVTMQESGISKRVSVRFEDATGQPVVPSPSISSAKADQESEAAA